MAKEEGLGERIKKAWNMFRNPSPDLDLQPPDRKLPPLKMPDFVLERIRGETEKALNEAKGLVQKYDLPDSVNVDFFWDKDEREHKTIEVIPETQPLINSDSRVVLWVENNVFSEIMEDKKPDYLCRYVSSGCGSWTGEDLFWFVTKDKVRVMTGTSDGSRYMIEVLDPLVTKPIDTFEKKMGIDHFVYDDGTLETKMEIERIEKIKKEGGILITFDNVLDYYLHGMDTDRLPASYRPYDNQMKIDRVKLN